MSEAAAPLVKFLVELRRRLINCVALVSLLFFGLLYFSNDFYTLLALPLLKHLPHGQGLIATHIVAPFFVPFKLTLMVSLFAAIPFVLYQLWAFIAPALYQHEKHFVWPLLLASTGLFYCGMAFAYFVIFPILFGFFAKTAPQGVIVSPDISQYLDFTMQLFFLFGAVFEVPIVVILLIWTGITTREALIQFRPYAIVSSFVIGMLFGPPDVLSQTLIAVPLWLLFEVGIFLSPYLTSTSEPGA